MRLFYKNPYFWKVRESILQYVYWRLKQILIVVFKTLMFVRYKVHKEDGRMITFFLKIL